MNKREVFFMFEIYGDVQRITRNAVMKKWANPFLDIADTGLIVSQHNDLLRLGINGARASSPIQTSEGRFACVQT